jgi:hypothetical protein
MEGANIALDPQLFLDDDQRPPLPPFVPPVEARAEDTTPLPPHTVTVKVNDQRRLQLKLNWAQHGEPLPLPCAVPVSCAALLTGDGVRRRSS